MTAHTHDPAEDGSGNCQRGEQNCVLVTKALFFPFSDIF